MKKLIIIVTGIIVILGLTACGEPPKAKVSDDSGVEEIQIEEIRVEEIRVEEIKVEEILTEDILKEDVITWDSPSVTRWE